MINMEMGAEAAMKTISVRVPLDEFVSQSQETKLISYFSSMILISETCPPPPAEVCVRQNPQHGVHLGHHATRVATVRVHGGHGDPEGWSGQKCHALF